MRKASTAPLFRHGVDSSAGKELQGSSRGRWGASPSWDAKDRLNAQLLKRTAVLERKLHIAEAVIALQKKGSPNHVVGAEAES